MRKDEKRKAWICLLFLQLLFGFLGLMVSFSILLESCLWLFTLPRPLQLDYDTVNKLLCCRIVRNTTATLTGKEYSSLHIAIINGFEVLHIPNGLACQHHEGFPLQPLAFQLMAKNFAYEDPLAFSQAERPECLHNRETSLVMVRAP